MCAWVERTVFFISMLIFMLLVLLQITKNGSLWQPPKSLYPLAHWRQLVGWGAPQHVTVNHLQAVQPGGTGSLLLSCIQSMPEHTMEIWKDTVPSMKGS